MCGTRLLQMGPWQRPSDPCRTPETVGDRAEALIQASWAVVARGCPPQAGWLGRQAGRLSISDWWPRSDQAAQVCEGRRTKHALLGF